MPFNHPVLCLGYKMNRSLHLSARTLQVYTEACTRLSWVFSPDGLSTTLLSQG